MPVGIIGLAVAAVVGTVIIVFLRKQGVLGSSTNLVFKRVPLFKHLNPEDLEKLKNATETVNLRAGRKIFNEGDSGDALYIVARGKIEIVKYGEGAKQVLKVCKPGDIIGEMALLTGEPRTAAAAARTEASLYKLARISFDELTRNNQQLRETIWATYAWRVFDNFVRQNKVPKDLDAKNRQKWFMRHIPQNITMKETAQVPKGAYYVFILTGKVDIGGSEFKAPSLAPLISATEVIGKKASRLLWFPPVQV